MDIAVRRGRDAAATLLAVVVAACNEVTNVPDDPALIHKIYGEEVAFYQDGKTNGETTFHTTSLPGIGDGAFKVKWTYNTDGSFVIWTVIAAQGEVMVRAVVDKSYGGQESADAPLVDLVKRVLQKAVQATAG